VTLACRATVLFTPPKQLRVRGRASATVISGAPPRPPGPGPLRNHHGIIFILRCHGTAAPVGPDRAAPNCGYLDFPKADLWLLGFPKSLNAESIMMISATSQCPEPMAVVRALLL
jgi:hypothetical protein